MERLIFLEKKLSELNDKLDTLKFKENEYDREIRRCKEIDSELLKGISDVKRCLNNHFKEESNKETKSRLEKFNDRLKKSKKGR